MVNSIKDYGSDFQKKITREIKSKNPFYYLKYNYILGVNIAPGFVFPYKKKNLTRILSNSQKNIFRNISTEIDNSILFETFFLGKN